MNGKVEAEIKSRPRSAASPVLGPSGCRCPPLTLTEHFRDLRIFCSVWEQKNHPSLLGAALLGAHFLPASLLLSFVSQGLFLDKSSLKAIGCNKNHLSLNFYWFYKNPLFFPLQRR